MNNFITFTLRVLEILNSPLPDARNKQWLHEWALQHKLYWTLFIIDLSCVSLS